MESTGLGAAHHLGAHLLGPMICSIGTCHTHILENTLLDLRGCQVGWGFGQPGLLGAVLAQGRGLTPADQPKPFYGPCARGARSVPNNAPPALVGLAPESQEGLTWRLTPPYLPSPPHACFLLVSTDVIRSIYICICT